MYETDEAFARLKMVISYENEGIRIIDYYDINDDLILSVIGGINMDEFSFEFPTGRSASNRCGQGTIDYVVWAYEDDGWLSVTLFVTTLIAPEIGGVVVAACAINACLLHLH